MKLMVVRLPIISSQGGTFEIELDGNQTTHGVINRDGMMKIIEASRPMGIGFDVDGDTITLLREDGCPYGMVVFHDRARKYSFVPMGEEATRLVHVSSDFARYLDTMFAEIVSLKSNRDGLSLAQVDANYTAAVELELTYRNLVAMRAGK